MSSESDSTRPGNGPAGGAAEDAIPSSQKSTEELPALATAWDIKEWDPVDTRPAIVEFEDDATTTEMSVEHLPSQTTGEAFARLARMTRQLMAELAEPAPGTEETARERLRRRMTHLLERAAELDAQGQSERAVLALELAYTEDPDSALAHKLLSLADASIRSVFEHYLGDLCAVPRVAISEAQLAYENIEPQAAFLLSRIDGTISLNELFDIAGMVRTEALRYSAALLLRGILILSPP